MISGRKTESAHTAFPARYVEDFREADQTFLAAVNRDRGERVPVTCVSLAFCHFGSSSASRVHGGADVMGLQRSDKHRESVGHLRPEELWTKLLECLQQRECPDNPGRE